MFQVCTHKSDDIANGYGMFLKFVEEGTNLNSFLTHFVSLSRRRFECLSFVLCVEP